MSGKRRKHVPLRSCIVCQEKRPKRELIRVVCTPEGTIEVDPRGKRPGRGAYVCRDPRCWEAGLEPRKLARALKCPVTSGQVTAVQAQIAALLAGDALAEGSPAAAGATDLGE
ncbi:MAG TPA: YlxR family protein [Anaerolineae bacterium]|nr:YlxR family protein [Anaerolineae bacterium]